MINFFTGSLRKIDKELWARDTEGRQMGLNPYSQSVQPSRVLPPVYDEKNDKDDDGDSLLFFFVITYCVPGFVLNIFHGSFQIIISTSL